MVVDVVDFANGVAGNVVEELDFVGHAATFHVDVNVEPQFANCPQKKNL